MLRLTVRLLFILLTVGQGACPTGVDGGAACVSGADCLQPDPAPCSGCPSEHKEICVVGVCLARAADNTEFFADVNLDRSISQNVRSLVHVLVDPRMGESGRAFSCDDAFDGDRPGEALNVLAAGYKALSGGSYHPGVSLGRAPAGDVAILLLATSEAGGGGDVLAKSCVAPVAVADVSYSVGLVQLEP